MAEKKPCKTYLQEDLEEIAKRTNVEYKPGSNIDNTLIIKLRKELYEYVLSQPEGVEKYISKLIREDKKNNSK